MTSFSELKRRFDEREGYVPDCFDTWKTMGKGDLEQQEYFVVTVVTSKGTGPGSSSLSLSAIESSSSTLPMEIAICLVTLSSVVPIRLFHRILHIGREVPPLYQVETKKFSEGTHGISLYEQIDSATLSSTYKDISQFVLSRRPNDRPPPIFGKHPATINACLRWLGGKSDAGRYFLPRVRCIESLVESQKDPRIPETMYPGERFEVLLDPQEEGQCKYHQTLQGKRCALADLVKMLELLEDLLEYT